MQIQQLFCTALCTIIFISEELESTYGDWGVLAPQGEMS